MEVPKKLVSNVSLSLRWPSDPRPVTLLLKWECRQLWKMVGSEEGIPDENLALRRWSSGNFFEPKKTELRPLPGFLGRFT